MCKDLLIVSLFLFIQLRLTAALQICILFCKRIDDAGDFTNAADVSYRFVPCMTSGLSFYLAQKYRPELAQQMKLYYEDEFNRALTEDGSSTSTHITPERIIQMSNFSSGKKQKQYQIEGMAFPYNEMLKE